MDEATLERLRESSGLRLDREGQFWHGADRLEHARTLAALHRSLHRAPDGRWATIGTEWAYVPVEDTAFFVRALLIDDARGLFVCTLWGGEPVEVAASTLAAGSDDVLYVRLAGGARARLTRAAQLSLAARLCEGPRGFSLKIGAGEVAIGFARGAER